MNETFGYAEKFEWDCKGRHIEVYHTNRTVPVLIYIDGRKYGYAEFEKGLEPKLNYEIVWEELKLTLVFKNMRFTLYENGQPVIQEKSNFAERFQLEIKLFFIFIGLLPLLYPFIKNACWPFKLGAGVAGMSIVLLVILIFRNTKLSPLKKVVLCIPVSLIGSIVMLITAIGLYAQ